MGNHFLPSIKTAMYLGLVFLCFVCKASLIELWLSLFGKDSHRTKEAARFSVQELGRLPSDWSVCQLLS